VNGITQNLMNYEKHGIDLKVLDLDDMPDFPIEKHFEEANAYIDHYVSNQKSILVICTAGVSRSAALVISYLIKHKRMPYKIAFNTVKRARVFIQPNVGFERALKKYAETYSCELCDMERKTPWFDQYA
jgi:protein-tyrosine phosphatase